MIGKALLAAGSRPAVERRVRPMLAPLVRSFVAGASLADALGVAEAFSREGKRTILDLLGEDVGSEQEADAVAETLADAAKEAGSLGLGIELALKPSQVGARLDPVAARRRLEHVAEVAGPDVGVWLDMEGSDLTETTLRLYEALQPSWPGLGLALQAALRRSPADLARLLPLRSRLRLVKGAYLEPPSVAFQRRDEVRRAYRDLAERCLEAGCDLAIGSHDRPLVHALLDRACERDSSGSNVEVQVLYGVAPTLAGEVLARGVPVKVYVPYGTAWYPYYLRRLAERPANLVFAGKAVFALRRERTSPRTRERSRS